MAVTKRKSSYIDGVGSRAHIFINRVKTSKTKTRVLRLVDKRPLTSFFILLGALFFVILAGNILTRLGTKPPKETVSIKSVTVYSIGSVPKVSMQAKVQKAGVVKIVAQTSGIVQGINVNAGGEVSKGTPIVYLSSNYNGGNAPAVQAQIANSQYTLAKDNFETQKEVIKSQKEIATKSQQNSEELRLISQRSLGDTQELLHLNEELLNSLNQSLLQYSATNSGGLNDELIAQSNAQKSQLLAAVIQIRAQLRGLEYQATADAPGAELASLQKNITLKQLEIQDKTLAVVLETAKLQSALAGISASLMSPASPFDGTIEKIHVEVGQSVNPGTVIATVSSPDQHIEAVVFAPREMAQNISLLEKSDVHIGDKVYKFSPRYVTTEATNGQLHSVIYDISADLAKHITDESYLIIDIPVGYPDTTSTVPYIPIDSVFQTQDKAYVFILNGGKAESKEITLGSVFGRYVELNTGISPNTQIILNRNIIAGDHVTVSR